tara:strand:- start:4795 stop:4941 length:147 start_codon:yes stop_codon:yes gene_type:complete
MTKWNEVKDGGKGSSPRPMNKEKFDKNFDRIFRNKKNNVDKGKKTDNK